MLPLGKQGKKYMYMYKRYIYLTIECESKIISKGKA